MARKDTRNEVALIWEVDSLVLQAGTSATPTPDQLSYARERGPGHERIWHPLAFQVIR